jgi:uncharacterized protein (DUF1330 family)
MSAYIIAHVQVTNPVQYEEYKKWSTAAMKTAGAEVCVRGGQVQVLEGDWAPERIVVLKFPSFEAAKAFYELPEYLKAREEKPAAIMCTLEILDHTSKSGIKRFPTGGNEPILTKTGERIVDSKGRVSRVTTAGAAPSLGRYLLLAYLTPEHAVEGNELRVMYMNELYPVRVARVGSQPLFDPTDARMKS